MAFHSAWFIYLLYLNTVFIVSKLAFLKNVIWDKKKKHPPLVKFLYARCFDGLALISNGYSLTALLYHFKSVYNKSRIQVNQKSYK